MIPASTSKPRLERLPLLLADNPIFFITACTHERKQILASENLHPAFRDFALQAASHSVFVGRYVLMPDHVHLFAAFGSKPVSLSMWMKSLKNALSKSLRRQNIAAPHWQKDFFDHVLRSEESYAEKWQYVLDNPVRKGLVKQASDWPYQGEIHALEKR
jgi:REP element-mobilizing transposase RayT